MAEGMADKLKTILNNPEMMNMLSSFLDSGRENTNLPADEDEDTVDIKNVVSQINSESDKRITLLNALRPYMRQSRASSIDKAVRMLKITKLSSILKDL